MRILVVEDEKEIRKLLEDTLKAELFAVDSAEDGERGSFLARTNDYDLVILDNILPSKEGRQVCREIRDAGRTMPILMLSVKSEASTKADLLDAGADDYLTKPFALEELLARVRALLRRPKKIEGDTLAVGDLEMDPQSGVVKRGGKEIYLSRKEFALLEYMMRNADIVLSRGMIMEHVWDKSVDPFSNTIEAHIASLRRKIDGKRQTKLIHTVPVRGYKCSFRP